MKILDGRGTGVQAEVDNFHRLATKSVTLDEQIVANIEIGEAFNIATGTHSVPATGEHALLYLRNASPTRSLVIDSYTVSHSGGTAGDKNIRQTFYINGSAPTANNEQGIVNALNTRSPIVPDVDFQIWDDVGIGMTIADLGTSFGDNHFARGFQQVPVLSKFVIGANNTIISTVTVAETSNVSLSIAFHILEEGQGI